MAKVPIVTFIDTPGAFPGVASEERHIGEAIAVNLREMFSLTVPVLCIVIGEGGSGGALGMKDAHRKAKLLTEAINQPLGKAIYITENDFTNVRTYPRLMLSKANGVMEDAVAESEVADINFEKIKIESRVQIKFALE